ncbi:putative DBH-like monooxygenase protein 2 [Hyperolius riggenbachi]|uniref:putative DBH-like monooxygenase protein 2 n=1 Tax=Hyperolius riggenbachi TaxID=752182 RepID=UPI0035A27E2B
MKIRKMKMYMSWNVWLLLTWVVSTLGYRGAIDMPLSRELKSRDKKEIVLIKWGYDREMQEISIEIQTPVAPWVALGLSPDGNMSTTDFVVGGWNKSNQPFFHDAHIEGEWPPVKDKTQDYELLELSHNASHVVMRVWRKWFTCDSNDAEIENDTVRVIIVLGENHDFTFSEDRAYRRPMFLLEPIIEMVFPDDVRTYDFKLNDFLIPDHDTTYACAFIPMPNVSTKHHIIRYEPINDPDSDEIVHHILIYGCGNSIDFSPEVGDCYGSDPRYAKCMNSMFGWAIGGEPIDYPRQMGIPIGVEDAPQFVRIEIHYSNFENKPGILDSSGIRVYYTAQLREHDGGVLMTGIFTFPAQFIPPASKLFRNYGLCNTGLIPEMLGHPTPDFTIYSYLLHGHLTVRGMRVLQYRNGTYIGTLVEDKKYDFRFQQARHLPGTMQVKIGDQLVVECVASTLDRETVTYGGPSTLNEMCVTFLFYHPVVPIAACWSLADIEHVSAAMELDETENIMDAIVNINGVEWDDEQRAIAQRAIFEANHTAILTHREGWMINETCPLPHIVLPAPHPCPEDLEDEH